MISHKECTHPSTPAARAACRKARQANPLVKPTSVDDCLDALDRNTTTGHLNGPQMPAERPLPVIPRNDARDNDQPSWLSSEGVIRNGGIKPPGQEHMSSPTGSNKRTSKPVKQALAGTEVKSEGYFLYEGNTYRVLKSKQDRLFAKLITPENPFGEYAKGMIFSLHESDRIDAPDYMSHTIEPARPSAPAVTQPGFYELDGNIYKVKFSKSSGRLYALLVTEDDTKGSFASGVVFKLTEDMKLTEERAAAFGKITGQCLICNRTLTVQESIDRGIGPVCAGKMGW